MGEGERGGNEKVEVAGGRKRGRDEEPGDAESY